jgi:hypothetical protein
MVAGWCLSGARLGASAINIVIELSSQAPTYLPNFFGNRIMQLSISISSWGV